MKNNYKKDDDESNVIKTELLSRQKAAWSATGHNAQFA